MNIKLFSNNYKKIIDVQDRYEYNISHLPGSINIPYDDLINNYRVYLNKKDTYYLYCKSGKLSKRASIVLNYLGYNTFVVEK
jgi:rhodanese-related sulfurtransferase